MFGGLKAALDQGRSGSRGKPKRHEPISVDAYQLTNARLRSYIPFEGAEEAQSQVVTISCFDLSASID